MSIFVDRNHSRLQSWRQWQNVVLTIYMDSWFALPEDAREDLPFKFVLSKPTNQLLDKQGRVVAEFENVDGNLHLHWIRSFADLELLDAAGQTVRPQLEV